ncbi:hypothetical protein GCM10010358_72770 [Streptomyces minutiscleroticus]|uniref:Uncharacterized protein n=1 Tax=Streptomyces minutiscleroticus TaxID=68238 RepID=A0A918U8Y2_9ACTN|nr:hypothetical protein GCM10010358_72770 [Streptomyces minutiscleroticus]
MVGLDASLVDGADQEAGAVGAALFPDLRQHMGDKDGRVRGAVAAQMVAVGVGRAGPVDGARTMRSGSLWRA